LFWKFLKYANWLYKNYFTGKCLFIRDQWNECIFGVTFQRSGLTLNEGFKGSVCKKGEKCINHSKINTFQKQMYQNAEQLLNMLMRRHILKQFSVLNTYTLEQEYSRQPNLNFSRKCYLYIDLTFTEFIKAKNEKCCNFVAIL
jgi:hypothetical protein